MHVIPYPLLALWLFENYYKKIVELKKNDSGMYVPESFFLGIP